MCNIKYILYSLVSYYKYTFSTYIMAKVPQKYVPKHLTKKDKKRAKRELLRSRKLYDYLR